MSRRSARFDPNAAPLIELSLDENKVRQQGLDEGWTLIEKGSLVETYDRELSKWMLSKVIGFQSIDSRKHFTKSEIRAKVKWVETLENEVYSTANSNPQYNIWVLIKYLSKKSNKYDLIKWVLYDKNHSMLRPVKKMDKSIFSRPLISETDSVTNLRRTPRISSKVSDSSLEEPMVEASPIPSSAIRKRKRDKLEPIVFGDDFHILKKTCYTIKQNITRKLKNSVHAVLEDLNLVHPEKIVRLIHFAELSQAEAFKLATSGSEKCSGTSLYCYVGYRDLQRSTVLEAGQKLSKWYREYIAEAGKTIEDFERVCIPAPPPTPERKPLSPGTEIKEDSAPGFNTPQQTNLGKVNSSQRDKSYRERTGRKAMELEELDFTKWTFSCVKIQEYPPLFEVLLVLVAKSTVTIPLGKFPSAEIAKVAGEHGAHEAEKYVEARKKGLNGANIAPSKVLRNDKKSILKNLKRVIPGRVAKKVGTNHVLHTIKRNKIERKSPLFRPGGDESPQTPALSTTTMTLRKKRKLCSFDDTPIPFAGTDLSDNSEVKSIPRNHNRANVTINRKGMNVRVSHGIQEKFRDNLINWHSEGYRRGEKIYYTSFSFSDDPNTKYSLLDYVLVTRQERSDETSSSKLVFSIGQIEAIYLDEYEHRNEPVARLSWFYWQEETKLSTDYMEYFTACKLEGATEVYSSNDVELQSLSCIVASVSVLSVVDYVTKCRSIKEAPSSLFDRRLQLPFSVPVAAQASEQDFPNENVKQFYIRSKRKLVRSHLRSIIGSNCQLLACCSHHYDSRFNAIVGHTHPKRKENKGEDPFLAPFIKLSMRDIDLSKYFSPNDYLSAIRPQSYSVVDLEFFNETDYQKQKLSHQTRYYDILLKNIEIKEKQEVIRCNFTSEMLNSKPYVESLVNPGCCISLECFFEKRQGLIRNSHGLIHRSSDPYRVVVPNLDSSLPENGLRILQKFLVTAGFEILDLTLVPLDIIRGPIPRVVRAVSVRYLYGVRLLLKLNNKVKSPVLTVASKYYGKSAQEAQGLACFEAVSELLGIQTKYDVLPSSAGLPLKSREVMHLLQVIEKHGLSWDTCYQRLAIPGVNGIELKDYYYQDLCPTFFAALESGEFRNLSSNQRTYLRRKYEDSVLFPVASRNQANKIIRESIQWAKDVKKFFLRRNELAKSNKNHGIAFAVVSKTTIYQGGSSSFSPFLTTESQKLLNFHTRLTNLLSTWKRNGNDGGLRTVIDEFQKLRNKAIKDKADNSIVEYPSLGENSNHAKLCEGCRSYFDLSSVIDPPPPETPLFCNGCLDDRAYLYDHTSWGASGRLLSKIADQRLFFSLENIQKFMNFDFVSDSESENYQEKVQSLLDKIGSSELLSKEEIEIFIKFARYSKCELPLSEKEWTDNDQILREGTKTAILEGWRKENKMPTSAVTKFPRQSTRRIIDIQELDRDVLVSVNWATRHFADGHIKTLQVANRALGQALEEVTQQRNSLLQLLHEYESRKGTR